MCYAFVLEWPSKSAAVIGHSALSKSQRRLISLAKSIIKKGAKNEIELRAAIE